MNNLIHNFETRQETGITRPIFIAILVGAIILGTSVGFGITKVLGTTTTQTTKMTTTTTDTNTQTAGIADKKTFKDNAEGMLREGGFEDEGNFHLERPGGKSQNAYLTSSTVDLAQFVGKKVRVWGQTYKAQKAGWLMDVGLVEVL